MTYLPHQVFKKSAKPRVVKQTSAPAYHACTPQHQATHARCPSHVVHGLPMRNNSRSACSLERCDTLSSNVSQSMKFTVRSSLFRNSQFLHAEEPARVSRNRFETTTAWIAYLNAGQHVL